MIKHSHFGPPEDVIARARPRLLRSDADYPQAISKHTAASVRNKDVATLLRWAQQVGLPRSTPLDHRIPGCPKRAPKSTSRVWAGNSACRKLSHSRCVDSRSKILRWGAELDRLRGAQPLDGQRSRRTARFSGPDGDKHVGGHRSARRSKLSVITIRQRHCQASGKTAGMPGWEGSP